MYTQFIYKAIKKGAHLNKHIHIQTHINMYKKIYSKYILIKAYIDKKYSYLHTKIKLQTK